MLWIYHAKQYNGGLLAPKSEGDHRFVEDKLYRLPNHRLCIPLSQIISCLSKKVLCQVTDAVTVMKI